MRFQHYLAAAATAWTLGQTLAVPLVALPEAVDAALSKREPLRRINGQWRDAGSTNKYFRKLFLDPAAADDLPY
jgi:hypothetical protein